jgi:proline iminopeptidase
MRRHFPEVEPYKSFQLKVSDIHQIYVEECGNPNGQPVVFFHGGPGAGLTKKHRRFFDPAHYRIILFDQRGAGKSTPFAELRENTTWDLVEDIEKIRKHLGISRWLVFGGSWGSTLALAYAETYSEKVTGLITRGIFLIRKKEVDWFYQEGCDFLFPELFQDYVKPIPKDERSNMMAAYYKRLTSSDPETQLEAAKAWSTWEGSTLKLLPDQDAITAFGSDRMSLSLARIECHYFINNGFFPTDNYLIENVHKISKIPGVIVHGRYDVVCPISAAWDLHQAWPSPRFVIVPDAGHAADEPGILHELITATEDFKGLT